MNEMNERKNAEYYNDPTPFEALKNAQGWDMRTIRRGEIYWCEHKAAQRKVPAVIVSNDTGNKHSGRVMVCYLSTSQKKHLPTHAPVNVYEPSHALCETIQTLDKEDVHELIRTATEAEMEGVNAALACALALDAQPAPKQEEVPVICVEKPVENEQVIRAQVERDLYRQLYEDLLARMIATEGRG